MLSQRLIGVSTNRQLMHTSTNDTLLALANGQLCTKSRKRDKKLRLGGDAALDVCWGSQPK